MIYVGLDLAWKPWRPSGLVALRQEPRTGRWEILEARRLATHADLLQELPRFQPPDRYGFLVDAPLLGEGPFRRADRTLRQVLQPFRVGLLPFQGLNFDPLIQAFRSLGYVLYPPPESLCTTGGWVVEVYPQAVAVGFLRQRLPYKRGPWPARLQAWQALLTHLSRRLQALSFNQPEDLADVHLRDAWVAALGAAVACTLGCARWFPPNPKPEEPYLWIPWLEDQP